MPIILSTPLIKIRKIPKSKKEAFERLNLYTLKDLLFYYPYRYDDFSTITNISKLLINQKQTIKGKIISIENKRTNRRRMVITEAIVSDETGSIKVVWFNQFYLKKYFPKGTEVILHGKVERGYQGLQMTSPVFEKNKENSIHTNRIVPRYSETANLTSKWLRFFIHPLLKYADSINDFLPKETKGNQNLIDLPQAVKQIHFPDNIKKLEKARKRLAFDELFLVQLDSQIKKKNWSKNKSKSFKFDQNLIKSFVENLPFVLTNDQKVVTWEILKDLENNKPMARLIEGDVGSGKTVVSAMASLQVAENKSQIALMAPTEILARQHFQSFIDLFKNTGLNIGLLTRTENKCNKYKSKNREDFLGLIEKGKIDILIGTHALIQENVKFKNLGLIIIDEQHRFGVKQRANMQKINKNKLTPHLLSMTATPIPRTLALAIYGDLDLSIIKEKPLGRKKIITRLVQSQNRKKAYHFIENQIKQGRQAFVICPRIESKESKGKNINENISSWDDVKAVKEEFKKLSEKIFPKLKIGLLHGKLKKDEKEKVMDDFSKGDIDILVSTSVVEVGVDVPNATIMMIEGAEKFGLAQLHQFRGRVGRGEHQSYCFLFSDSKTDKAIERLSALVSSDDGFELAEKDLEFRGPGEVYGQRQSGLPDLKMASLTDYETLKNAQYEAAKIIKEDSNLKNYPLLKKELSDFLETVHFE